MSAKLAHQLLDDDRVVVSFVGKAQSLHVTAAEARRFAWSVLADLDPAEADALGYTPPPVKIEHACAKPEREWHPGGWQMREVMQTLIDRPRPAPQVAARCGISRTQASVQLNKLMHRGLVRKVTLGRPYFPGTWDLTAAGHTWLAKAEEQAA